MGEIVEFPSNGRDTAGYLATPTSGRGPGVVVIQEYWGLVGHIRAVCDRLAAEGFVALAPDLFHGRTATEPDEASKLAMALRLDEAGKDLAGAVRLLVEGDAAAGNLVGTVGFCMGGGLALYAATRDPAIAAAVAFYPPLRLVAGAELGGVRAALQCHFAADDHSYTRAEVEGFERRIAEAGVDLEVYWYEGAGHAFFNDERAEVYRPDAARVAWERTLAFFRKQLVMTAAPVG